jgi:hypothetical protein
VSEQVVTISPRATAFSVVCAECAAREAEPGWVRATFAGRLDLDLDQGMFLCRRGHSVRVERSKRAQPAATQPQAGEAA